MERTIENLIGDRPVSEQLDAALGRMAARDHKHENYITREEFVELQLVVDRLVDLIGDESVAAQINNAINNRK